MWLGTSSFCEKGIALNYPVTPATIPKSNLAQIASRSTLRGFFRYAVPFPETWLIWGILLSFSSVSFSQDNNLGKPEFKKIIEEHWANTSSRFDHASNDIRSRTFEVDKYSDEKLFPHTAYGARASVII